MPQRPENKPETTQMNIRLPVAHFDSLKTLAERNHRTVSQEVRRLVDEALEREDLREAA